jgi:3-hydroxymyristoyl/3-hydroxydecanoyl-(acyl carrier protein) dehydratase
MAETEPRDGREPARRPRLEPELVAEQWTAHTATLELRVPEDLDCWPGHFPERSIVPGFLQLAWVMGLAARWVGPSPQVRRIEGLKFKNVLCPGERFTLTLERADEGAALRFRLAKGSRAFSLGRFVLAAEGGSGR